jgi:hypothetical protein
MFAAPVANPIFDRLRGLEPTACLAEQLEDRATLNAPNTKLLQVEPYHSSVGLFPRQCYHSSYDPRRRD